MRKTITRTITTNSIRTATIEFKDGKPVAVELEPITMYGDITNENALKIAKKKYGKNSNLVLVAVDRIENLYEISVSDFVKHGKIVDENKTENESAE